MIACLGWGSLVWDPRELPVVRRWFSDGPLLPIEFTRISKDARLTLAITPRAAPVRVLWSLMTETDVDKAVAALVAREGCEKNPSSIECWKPGEANPELIPNLSAWAERLQPRAVIWTGLKPKFRRMGDGGPSQEQALDYLRSLGGNPLEHARQYVQRAPLQVDTPYRRAIEANLQWWPLHHVGSK